MRNLGGNDGAAGGTCLAEEASDGVSVCVEGDGLSVGQVGGEEGEEIGDGNQNLIEWEVVQRQRQRRGEGERGEGDWSDGVI